MRGTGRPAALLVALLVVGSVAAAVPGAADVAAASETGESRTVDLASSAENVSISHDAGGGSRASEGHTSAWIGISTDRNVTIDHGNNYHFRFVDEDSGESVTVDMNGSVAAARYFHFSLHTPAGEPEQDPELVVSGDRYPVEIVDGSITPLDGVTNVSIAILDASTGEVIDTTRSEPYYFDYTSRLHQNDTNGDVRLWMPREAIPPDADLTLTLRSSDGGEEHDFEMAYEPGSDEFATVVDADEFTPGNYTWEVTVDWGTINPILTVRSYLESWEITLNDGSTGTPTPTSTPTSTPRQTATATPKPSPPPTVIATPAGTVTQSASPTDGTDPDSILEEVPGFGTTVAVIALLAGLLLVRRRDE